MIEPVFEELAHQKTHGSDGGRAVFVKVDMAVGMGAQAGAEWGVRVTPTFLFFLDGKKVSLTVFWIVNSVVDDPS